MACDISWLDRARIERVVWSLAALFLLTGQLVFTSLLTEAGIAFGDGIVAADPDATGTYRWPGIRFLQSAVTYEFEQGQRDWAGGAWTPLAWALWIVATIAVGRLWRVIPLIRRRRRPATV